MDNSNERERPNFRLKAVLNPLLWLRAEKGGGRSDPEPDTLKSFFAWAAGTLLAKSPDTLVDRYKKLRHNPARLSVVPYHKDIYEKLIVPLQQAKAAFAMGHELATIALCGLAGEMAAVLIFNIGVHVRKSDLVDVTRQEKIFGRPFTKLPQSRRREILIALMILNAKTASAMDQLAKIRNRYVHPWDSSKNMSNDAIQAFSLAVDIVTDLLGFDVIEGSLGFRAELLKFLEDGGTINPINDVEGDRREDDEDL